MPPIGMNKEVTECFSAAFRVTTAYFVISRFLVLCTVFNSYFAWLLRISACDNADYTSRLFCPKIGMSSVKRRNLYER